MGRCYSWWQYCGNKWGYIIWWPWWPEAAPIGGLVFGIAGSIVGGMSGEAAADKLFGDQNKANIAIPTGVTQRDATKTVIPNITHQ